MTAHLTPLLRYCLETTAAKLADEFHHHVWELIETLMAAANLLELQRPTGSES